MSHRRKGVGVGWKRIVKRGNGRVFIVDEHGGMKEVENPRNKDGSPTDFLKYRHNRGTRPL